MRFWIIALRILGIVMLAFTVLDIAAKAASSAWAFYSWNVLLDLAIPEVELLALAVLCLGAASGLAHLEALREQIARVDYRPLPGHVPFPQTQPMTRSGIDDARSPDDPPSRPASRTQPGQPIIREAPAPLNPSKETLRLGRDQQLRRKQRDGS